MLNKEQCYQIIDFIVATAPNYDVRVLINSDAEGLTRYANSTIHQNVFEDLTTVTITVIQGQKRSEQRTTDYSEEGLRRTVAEAVENLAYLPDGGTQPPASREPQFIEAEHYSSELAQACGVKGRALQLKEALAILPPEYQAYGIFTHTDMQLAYGNSLGVKRFVHTNSVRLTVLIADGQGGTGFKALSSRNPGEIDVKEIFAQVLERAKLNVNPVQVEPGAYTVILEPAAVANIMMYLSFTGFSAKSVQARMSFLSGKLGEQVFDERISITDDWHNLHTLPLPFDMEGYPRQKVEIIAQGVARELVYDTLTALADGVNTTGHSVNMPARGGIPLNIIMAGGDKSLEAMIAESDDAILITRFHYMNVINPRQAQLTGLTRDGVFHVKDGKIVGAIKNMRFTESILAAFNKVEAISSDRTAVPSLIGNTYLPAMKLREFHFTGKTE